MSDIKAIIFDIGGVLVGGGDKSKKSSVHSGVHDSMAHHFGISLDTWFDSIETPYSKSIEGKINGEEAIKIIAKNLHTNEEKLKRIWMKCYKSHLNKNKHLFNIAFKLKEKGYRIGILSDQWYLSKIAFLPKNDKDLKKFNPIIVSCDVLCRKPSKKIYRLLIKKLKLKPEEILFIDNRDWNTKPAKKLGMNVILFKNNKQTLKEMHKLGLI